MAMLKIENPRNDSVTLVLSVAPAGGSQPIHRLVSELVLPK